jgi:muramoyltetrapeptide carboxypeptidase
VSFVVKLLLVPEPLKPPALRPGDRVGIIAPASNVDSAHLQQGIASLERMGYEAVHQPGILDQDLYFAGTPHRRLREFHEMFTRNDVKAILCARGGYGANYLLPHIDIELVRSNPKIFLGYSDVTCLLTYLYDATGLVTFHGPMVAKDFAETELPGVDEPSWRNALGGNPEWELASHTVFGLNPLVAGEGEGVLYGGCLSILVASLGTPYEAKTEGKILFLEDISAKPYQIDRMLMQLKLAGKFNGVRGIVFGEMLHCVQSPEQGYTLQEIVFRIVEDLKIPVAYGLRSGHVTRENITLPFGIRTRLTVAEETVRLELLESAVLR